VSQPVKKKENLSARGAYDNVIRTLQSNKS